MHETTQREPRACCARYCKWCIICRCHSSPLSISGYTDLPM